MSVAVCLLAYSMVVAVFGPPLVSSLTATGAAPRLGVGVWLTMMASVLAAWVGAVVLSVADIVNSWDDLGRVLTGCVAALRAVALGGSGPLVQAVLLTLAGVSVAAVVVLAARVTVSVHRTRRRTRAHAHAARLAAAGSPPGPAGALVIDSGHRVAYCLAGRPDTVVITTAALDALTEDQLAAVLAHERAHLSEGHHPLLAVTTALGTILARLRLFGDGATDIARLLEMCADDTAARQHTRRTVADALVALALPRASNPSPTPALALGAADRGVAQRVERLLFPVNPAGARLAMTLTICAVLLGPALSVGMRVLAPMACGR